MDIAAIGLTNAAQAAELESPAPARGNAKLESAATQFESLLMTELLRASKGDSGWLGTGDDTAMSSATDVAQEYFAQGLTAQGGIGIAQYVQQHLAKSSD